MHPDFDALALHHFLGPDLPNHGTLSDLLLAATYSGYVEQSPRR